MMNFRKKGKYSTHVNITQVASRKSEQVGTRSLDQSNQWVRLDRAARIHLRNSPPTTSSVEKNKMKMMITGMIQIIMIKKNVSDIYEQCEYKMDIINKKKKYYGETHIRHT